MCPCQDRGGHINKSVGSCTAHFIDKNACVDYSVDVSTDIFTATLADVCAIQIGFTARGRLESVTHGGVLALQLRDFLPNGRISEQRLARVQLEGASERYLARTGDVVFRSRGERNTAAVIEDSITEPVLAILPLMILRPNLSLVSGAYLAWTINQEPAQRHFEEEAQGTSLRMVSRSAIERLKIAIPSFEIQQRILQVDALAERERELAEQLTLKNYELIHRLLVERAKEYTSMRKMERMPR